MHRRGTRKETMTQPPPPPGQASQTSPMSTSVPSGRDAAGCPGPQEFNTYMDKACTVAEQFTSIYYDTMDNRRRDLTSLYVDTSTVVWNGNAIVGLGALNHFFAMLPSSDFKINMLDCQPVYDQATQAYSTILLMTGGTVKFNGNQENCFTQNFLLSSHTMLDHTVWHIASDCFRFQN